MRPTLLQFRSPKERTPAFYDSDWSYRGRQCKFQVPKYATVTSFTTTQRFKQYQDYSKRTGFLIGPGSYDLQQKDIGRGRVKGTPRFFQYHNQVNTGNNAYYMVGNTLVYEPQLNRQTKSKLGTTLLRDVDTVMTDRPKSVESRRSTHRTRDTDSTPIKKNRSVKMRSIKRIQKKNPYLAK